MIMDLDRELSIYLTWRVSALDIYLNPVLGKLIN